MSHGRNRSVTYLQDRCLTHHRATHKKSVCVGLSIASCRPELMPSKIDPSRRYVMFGESFAVASTYPDTKGLRASSLVDQTTSLGLRTVSSVLVERTKRMCDDYAVLLRENSGRSGHQQPEGQVCYAVDQQRLERVDHGSP